MPPDSAAGSPGSGPGCSRPWLSRLSRRFASRSGADARRPPGGPSRPMSPSSPGPNRPDHPRSPPFPPRRGRERRRGSAMPSPIPWGPGRRGTRPDPSAAPGRRTTAHDEENRYQAHDAGPKPTSVHESLQIKSIMRNMAASIHHGQFQGLSRRRIEVGPENQGFQPHGSMSPTISSIEASPGNDDPGNRYSSPASRSGRDHGRTRPRSIPRQRSCNLRVGVRGRDR